jgi:hypothetical protein
LSRSLKLWKRCLLVQIFCIGGGAVLKDSIQGYDGDLAKHRQFTTQRPVWIRSLSCAYQASRLCGHFRCDLQAHSFESAGWLSDRAIHIHIYNHIYNRESHPDPLRGRHYSLQVNVERSTFVSARSAHRSPDRRRACD